MRSFPLISPRSRIGCLKNCPADRRSASAIARALVQSPTLLLADEPTGQLDHRTGQATLSVMLDHVRRRATTFVVATHDPDDRGAGRNALADGAWTPDRSRKRLAA